MIHDDSPRYFLFKQSRKGWRASHHYFLLKSYTRADYYLAFVI